RRSRRARGDYARVRPRHHPRTPPPPKGPPLNRLAATPRDNRGALTIVLDHLHDTNQDEFNAAIDMLADRAYGPTIIARAVTDIARDDNRPVKNVDESAIRKYRDREGIKWSPAP